MAMNATYTASAELLRNLGFLADSESYMKRLQKYVRRLVAQKEEEETEWKPRTKEEVRADMKEALTELKLNLDGKMQFKTLEEALNEL